MANVKQLNTKNQYGDFEGLPDLYLVKVANGLYYIADEYRHSVAVVKRPESSKTWSLYYWELQKDGSVDKIFWQEGKTAKFVISSFMRAVAFGVKYYPEPGQELPLGVSSLYADQESKIDSNQDVEDINTPSSEMTRQELDNPTELGDVYATLKIADTTSFDIRKLKNDSVPYTRYGVYQNTDLIPGTEKSSIKDAVIAAYNSGVYYHINRVRDDIKSDRTDSFDDAYTFGRKVIAFSEFNPGVMFWKAEDLLGTLRVFGFSEPEEPEEPANPELGVWVESELFSNLLRVTEDVTINIHQGSYGKYAVYVNEGGNSRLDAQADSFEEARAHADKTATLIHYTNLARIKSELYGISIDRKDGKTAKYTDDKRQSIQKTLMEFSEFSGNLRGREMSEWLNGRLEYCFEMMLYVRAYDNGLTPSDVARLSI